MEDANPDPKTIGFWVGLTFARDGKDPLPPNPYYLRTPERTAWSYGYARGRALGYHQKIAAEEAASELHKGT